MFQGLPGVHCVLRMILCLIQKIWGFMQSPGDEAKLASVKKEKLKKIIRKSDGPEQELAKILT